MKLVAIPLFCFFTLVAGGCGSPPEVTTHRATEEPSPVTAICVEKIEFFGDEEFTMPPKDHPAIREAQSVIRSLAEGALRRQGFTIVPADAPCEKLRAIIAVAIGVQFLPVVWVKSEAFIGAKLLFELRGYARSRSYAKDDIVHAQESLADELAYAFRKRIKLPLSPATPSLPVKFPTQ